MLHRAISIKPGGSSADAEQSAGNDRYQVHRLLGRGGMALVYEATDRTNDRRVALKRLQALPESAKQRRNLELFEREFHTLSQLAHPRIVRVFDFGVDQIGAYYAMELLEGGDLQELAPVPWRRACAIGRDVCSALSLLHSRRFVHRDVSPRNVRCIKDGPAKLIDFGAMAPVGPTKLLVGTPPCCAPESVHLQSLDGRTDLFGLGATLYFVLVGQHAYPARQFDTLPAVWRAGFPRPSELVADIPPQLDALVLDLLRIEPDARPASAAEVMARLSAIDGESATEQLMTAAAYLATPTLVGRDAALARVHRRVTRGPGHRSRSVVIEGAAGVGRTRFLDACLLDATLAGQVLVRVDSDDAVSGDYGVVRALAQRLIELMPVLARETAAPALDRLITLIPALASDPATATLPPAIPGNDVAMPRGHLQRALLEWLSSLSKRQPLVMAIDDFHRIDEPSAALIALLERDSTEHELCLLITVEAGAGWTAESARRLLAPLTTLRLDALSGEDGEKLLRSVFGSVPHLELLAHRICELCAGCPRDLLRLAQHLVDRNIVRYTAGAWTLPAEIDAADLPSSLFDALADRISALPPAARELGSALALCPDQSFSFEECALLTAAEEPAARVAQVEALISAEIVRWVGDDVRLSQRSWVPSLLASTNPELTSVLEQRLAELFERRDGQEFRAAQHWFRAGQASRALDLLVVHAAQSQETTARGPEIFLRYFSSLPEAWFETFHEALRFCDSLNRPRKQRFALLSRLVGIMAMLNTHAEDLLAEVFVDLRRDSGYDDWHALDPNLDPRERLMTALTRTKARYDAQPEHERVLDPTGAIRALTRAVVAAAAPTAMALDVATLRSLPQLRMFAALSPALEASNKLLEGVDARCTGRIPLARRVYAELLTIIERPDRGGVEESFAAYMRLGVINGLGMIEAGLGLRSCLDWAEKIADHPAYEVNASVIRMLNCLFQGDVSGAEEQKRLADRLRIQNSGRQMHEGGHLIWEVQAHAISGDLTRIRHVSEDIVPLAKRYPQWIPVLRYSTAEYHRLTHDFTRARAEIETVLGGIQAGTHQIWPHAAHAHILCLIELEQYASARDHAEAYVTSAARELSYVPDSLQLSLALARTVSGDDQAASGVDELIARLLEMGVAGLHLGIAHETRARIALQLHDMAAFARHVELCRQSYFAHKNSALTAKYHRLLQDARRNLPNQPERARGTPDSVAHYGGTRIELALAGCRDEDQRARLALTLLTRQSGAAGGMLFLIGEEAPYAVARIGSTPEPDSLLERVQNYLASQIEANERTSTASDAPDPELNEWRDPDGLTYRPVLISHYDAGNVIITGVAVLVVPAQGEFVHPGPTATSVSRFYADKGATSMMMMAD
jgi:hypothetical protein